ncbi:MAG: ATP-binding protein [Bacteroidota bacterium]
MSRFILFWALLLISGTALAETKVIDSLSLLLPQAKEDSVRVNLLNKLAWEYHRVEVKKTQEYGQQALELSNRIDYYAGASRALNLLAIVESLEGRTNEAITLNQEALGLAMKCDSRRLQSNALNDLAISFAAQNRFSEALSYYQQALALDDSERGRCFTLVNIGILHSELENRQKAIEYFRKAIKVAENSDDHLAKTAAYESMAYSFLEEEKKDSAYVYFNKVIKIAEAHDNRLSQAYALMSIGDIEGGRKHFEIADLNYEQAIGLLESMGDQSGLSDAYLGFAKLQKEKQDYTRAINYFMEVKDNTALKLKSSSYKEALKGLAECYNALGQFEMAYTYQKNYQTIADSLFNEKKSEQFAELETKYQFEKKETENKLLKENQIIQEELINQHKSTSRAIAIFLLIVSIAAIILYREYRRKRDYNTRLLRQVRSRTADLEKSNEQLKRSNKELESFAYIASHDLKEPLRNIFSFTRLLERKMKDQLDEQSEEYISFIKQNTKQLNVLIEDVLEYSRVEKGDRRREKVDVNTVLDRIKMVLPSEAFSKGGQLNCSEMPTIWSYSSSLFLVFKNLIENGIKYNTEEQVVINISYKFLNKRHVFYVQDNGIGIEPEFHKQIFEMFKRLHTKNNYQGSGLGLAICRKIIDRLSGDIWVEKSSSEGTTIAFSLPYDGKQKMMGSKTMSKIALAN